jgi:hypothetical protein
MWRALLDAPPDAITEKTAPEAVGVSAAST